MIALIDGDVLAYGACKARWQDKAENGMVLRELEEDGSVKPLEFTTEEDRKYLEECWANLQKNLESMLETIFCEQYLMAVKGKGNFRDDLYEDYKANRKKRPSPNIFVPAMRELMIMEELAIASDGREADDMLRIWAEQCRMHDIDYIVCSIDKDLKCIPGKHYIMHKDLVIDIAEEEAMRHYYEQLLKGDPTDNIPGVPRVGEVKAAKVLKPYSKEEDFQEKVISEYIAVYGDEWREYLLINGKLIHLQKDINDYFNLSEWPLAVELL